MGQLLSALIFHPPQEQQEQQALKETQDTQALKVIQDKMGVQELLERLGKPGLQGLLGHKESQEHSPTQVLQALQAQGETLAQLEAKVLQEAKESKE
jgi:hypothetical protein